MLLVLIGLGAAGSSDLVCELVRMVGLFLWVLVFASFGLTGFGDLVVWGISAVSEVWVSGLTDGCFGCTAVVRLSQGFCGLMTSVCLLLGALYGLV